MNTREKINTLTNHGLEQAIANPTVQGVISHLPCRKCGGEVVKHFRYRGEWSGYFARCKNCGDNQGSGEV